MHNFLQYVFAESFSHTDLVTTLVTSDKALISRSLLKISEVFRVSLKPTHATRIAHNFGKKYLVCGFHLTSSVQLTDPGERNDAETGYFDAYRDFS